LQGGATTAGFADAVGGPVLEVGIEFFASASDGIGMHSRDLREQNVATMSDRLGFESSKPSSLLFVEATEKQVDVVMDMAFGMVLTSDAGHALALVNRDLGHDKHSLEELPTGVYRKLDLVPGCLLGEPLQSKDELGRCVGDRQRA